MQTPGQDLFRSILRVFSGTIKPSHSGAGVTLEWDLEGQQLRGTFKIPINTKIDNETGQYIIVSQDFVFDRVESP